MPIKSALIVGCFNQGAIENIYAQEFRALGITIDTYDIYEAYWSLLRRSIADRIWNKVSPEMYYGDVNRDILLFIEKKRFDLILVFKGMTLFPETILQLKACTSILANYNPDHPFQFFTATSGNRNVVDSISYYDIYFSYAKSIVEQIKNKFEIPAYCIPFGYDRNICSTNNLGKHCYSGKMLFIGAYDYERSKYLSKVAGHGVNIYGEHKWRSRTYLFPAVRAAYQNSPLYGEDYATAIRSSNGIINLLRKQNLIEGSHNMKTFEVPGYGGLLLSQRTHEQCAYFEENTEAFYFDSVEELKSKIDYLNRNPIVVQRVKSAAYKRSTGEKYSYYDRCKQMIDIFER
ncbi:glycosyltransferase family 1 protein [Segetibacter sp. 3557_3]|uniref:glycosyltransferase family protein n=1 Tax=Segetibacter sp. 3557_3 TaxID=2547429 RepID=UPI0010590D65|nr:glycosyltransferase [Segetibacter sp. 3557_3]TDH20700.1 glycosyltransferase family 1 protein [Segetibacter sp. 3557_3]